MPTVSYILILHVYLLFYNILNSYQYIALDMLTLTGNNFFHVFLLFFDLFLYLNIKLFNVNNTKNNTINSYCITA